MQVVRFISHYKLTIGGKRLSRSFLLYVIYPGLIYHSHSGNTEIKRFIKKCGVQQRECCEKCPTITHGNLETWGSGISTKLTHANSWNSIDYQVPRQHCYGVHASERQLAVELLHAGSIPASVRFWLTSQPFPGLVSASGKVCLHTIGGALTICHIALTKAWELGNRMKQSRNGPKFNYEYSIKCSKRSSNHENFEATAICLWYPINVPIDNVPYLIRYYINNRIIINCVQYDIRYVRYD